MEIPCEMKVQIFHGNHLGIAAAGRSALNAKAGPKRRLTQGDYRSFPQLPEGFTQAYAGCGLAFPGGRGIDGCHQYQLSIRVFFDGIHVLIGYFRFILSVKLQLILFDPQLLRHLNDWLHDRFLCDFNICFHLYPP